VYLLHLLYTKRAILSNGAKGQLLGKSLTPTFMVRLPVLSLSKGRTTGSPRCQGHGVTHSEGQSVRSTTQTRAMHCHCRRTTSFDTGYRPLRMSPARGGLLRILNGALSVSKGSAEQPRTLSSPE